MEVASGPPSVPPPARAPREHCARLLGLFSLNQRRPDPEHLEACRRLLGPAPPELLTARVDSLLSARTALGRPWASTPPGQQFRA